MPGENRISAIGHLAVSPLNAETEHTQVEPAPLEQEEEIKFEDIEQKLGVMMILVHRDRATLFNLIARKTREQYKSQIKLHADTYRKITPVFLASVSVLLQSGSLAILLVPKLPITCQEGFNRLTNWNVDCLHVSRFCNDHGCVDVAMMPPKEMRKVTDVAFKFFSGSDQMVQTGSRLYETREQGTRTEAQAESELLRSDSENRRNDEARSAQEKSDALRQLREMQQQSHSAQQKMASFQS